MRRDQHIVMRALQSARIKELGEALVSAGYIYLDEQAQVLGLSRSTTWTILRASHKNSGLSAAVINRMLAQPRLPTLVRMKILEYVKEKPVGPYGHNRLQVRRFAAQLPLDALEQMHLDVRSKDECAATI